jgi:predicted ester cyclase
MGIPPTGKDVAVRVAAWDRFVGDKLVSAEIFMDLASLLNQLGRLELPKQA